MTDNGEITDMKSRSAAVARFFLGGAIWSFLGVLVTLLVFYLAERKNAYSFEITIDDEIDLVEVRERIEDLQILYKNQDLLDSQKAIKLLQITLRNLGKTIVQTQYDESRPFGLFFPGAIILRADVLASNSDYLKTGLLPEEDESSATRPAGPFDMLMPEKAASADARLKSALGRARSPGTLELQKLIFEKGKYVTLKVFLLLERSEDPVTVKTKGKIAHIDNLSVKRAPASVDAKPGSFAPSIGMLLAVYGGFLGFFVTGASLSALHKLRTNRERSRRIEAFRQDRVLSAVEDAIIGIYDNSWDSRYPRLLQSLVKGDGVLNLESFSTERAGNFKQFLSLYLSLFRSITSPSTFRGFGPISLPAEIFSQDGVHISLNKENEGFVREFFTEVGILKRETAIEKEPSSN